MKNFFNQHAHVSTILLYTVLGTLSYGYTAHGDLIVNYPEEPLTGHSYLNASIQEIEAFREFFLNRSEVSYPNIVTATAQNEPPAIPSVFSYDHHHNLLAVGYYSKNKIEFYCPMQDNHLSFVGTIPETEIPWRQTGSMAFSHDGSHIAAGGIDKNKPLLIWKL